MIWQLRTCNAFYSLSFWSERFYQIIYVKYYWLNIYLAYFQPVACFHQGESMQDLIIHYICLFWKVFFAFTIPPAGGSGLLLVTYCAYFGLTSPPNGWWVDASIYLKEFFNLLMTNILLIFTLPCNVTSANRPPPSLVSDVALKSKRMLNIMPH